MPPDFSRVLSPKLIISALGAAFFSLSLGVGTMLIYGSYISDKENLPVLGGLVTLVDITIAVLAGFLVLPAMYVALNSGVEIFTASGALICYGRPAARSSSSARAPASICRCTRMSRSGWS